MSRKFFRVSQKTFALAALFFAFAACASTRAMAAQTPPDVGLQIERGRVLLGLGDARATQVLQDATRASLLNLKSVSRPASPDENAAVFPMAQFSMPQENAARARWRRFVLEALEAHRWLARAQISTRDGDSAIATLATSLQLANLESENFSRGAVAENSQAQEARAQLAPLLPDGAPARATLATLQNLSRFFYRAAPPIISDFRLPIEAREYSHLRPEKEKRDGAKMQGGEAPEIPIADENATSSAKNRASHRFAFFDAPLAPSGAKEAASTRVPPIYRAYARESLPAALKMNRAVCGYRLEDGANAKDENARWKLVGRVFYASRDRTKNNRDDAPRARFLLQQLLRIAAMQHDLWGLENSETTSIWLLETGAAWPHGDEGASEIAIAAQAATTHAEAARSFRAGGWVESVPDEIFLFRADVPRTDFGWTRQLVHEYSHAVWPRLGGFSPPLEPFASGLLGETLTALQLARFEVARVFSEGNSIADASGDAKILVPIAPSEASVSDARNSRAATSESKAAEEFSASARAHVESHARPALAFWNARGPRVPAVASGEDSLLWLQGFCVYIARVSGDETLRQTLWKIESREYSQEESAASQLLAAYENAMRARWKIEKRVAWRLFESDAIFDDSASQLSAARFSSWIYLPPGARVLEIAWRASSASAPPQIEVTMGEIRKASRLASKKAREGLSLVALDGRGGWRKIEMQARGSRMLSLAAR